MDLTVRFGTPHNGFECRLVVHPNLSAGDAPRYLLSNLAAGEFNCEQVSDAYRLRWQVELLFEEWKSHTNLHSFDTSNANIAESPIRASLCAATLKRYTAQDTLMPVSVAPSTTSQPTRNARTRSEAGARDDKSVD